MLKDELKPFLEGNLRGFRGLPETTLAGLETAFGPPAEHSASELGFYPADRYVFPNAGLVAYVRDRQVVLLESLHPPSIDAVHELPEPCGVLPHEILVEDAYAHEFVYCAQGLVLTIAKPTRGDGPDQLVRARAIRPIPSVESVGPELYRAFEDRISF